MQIGRTQNSESRDSRRCLWFTITS